MGVGGTELNAFRTAVRIPSEEVRITVVCLDPDGPLRSEYEAAGIPVEVFAFPSFASVAALRESRRLRRWLRRHDVDVVHCHDIYSNIFGAGAGLAARKPAVVTSRRWGSARAAHLRWANRITNRLADAVVTNSSRGARYLMEEGVPGDRILHLPNFIEEGAFELPAEADRRKRLRELGVPEGARVLGIVANLNPWKDYPTLVRAFANVADRVPEWHLLGLGEGPEREGIEGLARDLGVPDRVHLPGRVPNRPNPHALFDLSTLVSPDEGSPNSVLEAMAAGRAVVATRVGGIPDLVEDGTNGLLVAPGDPDALAAALLELMEVDRMRSRMGRAGRERARANHGADRVIGQLMRLYGELTRRRRVDGDE